MKLITSIALTFSLALPVSSVFAASDSNPWKECGIGAMIFENNGTAAAISNIVWDLGTTAVSSNISSVENCNGKEAKTAMFIKQTYNNLIEETAQGGGEHLNAMFDLLKLAPQKRANTIEAIRADMAKLVASNNYAGLTQSDKAKKYFNSLIKSAS